MKKKKLFCMLLSIAMTFTSVDFPAFASEVLAKTEESRDSSEEISTVQQSTQQESTETNVTEQESVYSTVDEIESETEESTKSQPETSTVDDAKETTESKTEDTTDLETEGSTETQTETSTVDDTQETTESKTEDATDLETEESTETQTETSTELETETSTEATTEESTDSNRQDTKLQVSYRTTDEILAFLEQENAAKTDKITYKEQPVVTAPYKLGALSDDTLGSAMAMVRQIRFIAGLPYEDISLNDTYTQLSQSAALVNYVNNELSSEPSQPSNMPDELFEQGCEGAANSNIAYASQQTQTLNETLLSTWMAAKDKDAISQLEDRRNLLNPSMEQIGFGAVKGSNGIYSAMYIADRSGNTENMFGIAWPAQNMPIEYFGSDYPWSVSTDETLKASEIRVTLTRESDGKEWNFSKDSADGDFYVDNDSSAQKSCIIFRPKASDITAYEDEDLFEVEITKNKKPYIRYTVQFFSIAEEEEILTAPEASISSGEVVAKESKLTLTSVEDAAIYYTLDGTTPSVDSTLYTEPISIEADITVKAIAVKEGFADSDIAEFSYTVSEDEPMRYTVTFESNGGTILSAQSVLENEKIALPEPPIKENDLFEGWYKEPECETIWDFENDLVTTDITLYAKWTEDPSVTVHTVSFELQEHGTPIESLTVKNGELVTAPEPPMAEGYQFEGWFQEPECTNAWDFAVDTVLSDIVLYAKWTETETETQTTDIAGTCLITFDLQGMGAPIEPVTVNSGETLAAPDTPTAEGYTFANWYREAECINAWDFEADIVTEDIVLYAKWVPEDNADVSMSASQETKETDTRIDLGAASTVTKISPENIKSRRYNSEPYEPSVTVSIANGKKRVTLKEDKDYTLTYQNNINPGTASVIITGEGKYKGRVIKKFTIDPPIDLNADLTQTIVSPENIKSRRQNGTPYEPSVTVSIYNGKKRVTLKKDRDYTLTYKNNTNYTKETQPSVTISGIREYKGSITKNFTIDPPIDLNADLTQTIVKDIKSSVYSGKPYEPNVTISILDGKKRVTLKKGRDYTLTYKNNTNANNDKTQPSVTISGIGEYTGSITKDFTITRKSIKKLKVITGSIPNNKGTPSIVIYDGSVGLNNNLFLAEYNREDPKKVTLTLKAKPNTNYEGSVTINLTVYDVEKEYYINNANLEIAEDDTTYTGKAISRNVKVTMGDTELRNNKDYKIQYQNNTNAGTATMIITGKGQYKGKVVKTFNIGKVDVSKRIATNDTPKYVDITDISPKTYNGKEQKPTVTIKTIRNKKLTLNKDYTVTYSNNLYAGTARLTIKGIGNNCQGSTTINFEIEPQQISKASVSVTKATKKVPSKVVLKYNKKELQEYADYLIENYEEKGTKVKVTIIGRANFKGEVTKTLKTDIPEPEPTTSPAVSSNINRHNYLNYKGYGLEVTSHLFRNDDGTLKRVEYVSGKGVYVENYTADYQFINQEKLIKPELPIYGGFYATKDNYFLVFGQENKSHDDKVEVIRFVKYDKNWNRQASVSLYGANTDRPFMFSSVRMVEHEGVLYVRTGHNMYNGHQASMAFSIDIPSMKFINQFYTLGGPSMASHSLNQFITMDEPYLITSDHGDAYPRGILLARHVKVEVGGKNIYFTSQSSAKTITALKVGGNPPSNVTGASLSGLEASDTSYLVVGSSVAVPPASYNPKGILNIYVSSTPKDDFRDEAVKVHWITDFQYLEYTDANGNPQKISEASIGNPQLVKINGNEMMLMWAQTTNVIENNKPVGTTDIKSILLNGNGEPISGIYSFEGGLSDCKPIVDNGNILWYYTNKSEPKFCSLNIDTVRKQPR